MEDRALLDVQLVEEIKRGESPAEATLYEKYAARVYYLALSELRSREDAEDVRAETFLRVLQAIRQDRVRSPVALASFVLGTTQNIIREFKRPGRRTEQLDKDAVEQIEASPNQSIFMDEYVKRTIEQVVRRLKPREQAFLRMYYIDEMSNDDIARALGIKEERLRLIKSRALKNFREMYGRLVKN
ncbi:MAG TPA: sigma-70 family RNA polymerase sigma factor [Blastocatellia bacterium]|nr:sigma-70 family RNA polymerase sigma factor [Blastocatellia bacterium]